MCNASVIATVRDVPEPIAADGLREVGMVVAIVVNGPVVAPWRCDRSGYIPPCGGDVANGADAAREGLCKSLWEGVGGPGGLSESVALGRESSKFGEDSIDLIES